MTLMMMMMMIMTIGVVSQGSAGPDSHILDWGRGTDPHFISTPRLLELGPPTFHTADDDNVEFAEGGVFR